MDHITETIRQLEGEVERLTRALEVLRPLANGRAAVETQRVETRETKKRPKVSGGQTLMDVVLDAVGHGNHDFRSVYSWTRKHGGLLGRKKLSIGPALASLTVKKKLVRLSPGVYHLPPSTVTHADDASGQ